MINAAAIMKITHRPVRTGPQNKYISCKKPQIHVFDYENRHL